MGTDNLADIKKWIKYLEVVYKNKFIVMLRNNFDIEKIFEENEIFISTRICL